MLQLALRRRHARQAACGSGWTEEGRRHRGAQRLGTAALVEAGGMAERGRLEALRECMMPDVAAPPWRSRFYLASGKVGNKSIASFQACTGMTDLPQLLTYRRGAANRRFGPVSDITVGALGRPRC
jgi:hypothetical protein